MLAALVNRKLISQAQADLVTSNSEAMGMPVLELLVARHWINEDTLAQVLADEATKAGLIAPASETGDGRPTKQAESQPTAATSTSSKQDNKNPTERVGSSTSSLNLPLSDDYNENLARYKKLIAKILREDNR